MAEVVAVALCSGTERPPASRYGDGSVGETDLTGQARWHPVAVRNEEGPGGAAKES